MCALGWQGISCTFNVNIIVHQLGSPPWEIRNFPPSAPVIHLSYHDGEHYASVRCVVVHPVQAACSTLAAMAQGCLMLVQESGGEGNMHSRHVRGSWVVVVEVVPGLSMHTITMSAGGLCLLPLHPPGCWRRAARASPLCSVWLCVRRGVRTDASGRAAQLTTMPQPACADSLRLGSRLTPRPPSPMCPV